MWKSIRSSVWMESELAKLAVIIHVAAFLASGRAEIRSFKRGFVPALLPVAVLAGLALTGRRRLLVGAALLAMMVESSNLPLSLSRYDGPPPAARWLAGKDGAVLYLPMGDVNTKAMLDQRISARLLGMCC